MAHKSDAEMMEKGRNTARFFVEHRQIAWILLIGTVIWGWYGYNSMPQRKDPDIPVRVAVAMTPWPGVQAQEVEQLVTRPIEEKIAENSSIHPGTAADYGIRSITLPGLSIVYVQLAESVTDTKRQLSDINLKLNALNNQLPQGAGPIQFQSDFGDTAALMLTVASPRLSEVEVAIRARSVQKAVEEARLGLSSSKESRVAALYCFPESVSPDTVRRGFTSFSQEAQRDGIFRDVHPLLRSGFIGVDAATSRSDEEIQAYVAKYIRTRLHTSELHPDAWGPVLIRDTKDTAKRMAAVAGDKYSYRELDDFTDLIARTLIGTPQASKYQRAGVWPEQIYLEYSQDRLASYGVQPSKLKDLLQARNITLPGGSVEVGSEKNVIVDPSGAFKSATAIGDVIIGTSSSGSPLYLRDLVEISRGYQSPPRYLNFYTSRDADGKWHRSRAVTIAIFMRSGEQIAKFGENIDAKLAAVRQLLPSDLLMVRTSDQPRQVKENIDLFMDALYEAIVLVVLVSLVGFWEWRSALLMALSIPITLAMTFGFTYMLGIDLQQVSIATLIIALGLLVDDPVVAGDAIKR